MVIAYGASESKKSSMPQVAAGRPQVAAAFVKKSEFCRLAVPSQAPGVGSIPISAADRGCSLRW